MNEGRDTTHSNMNRVLIIKNNRKKTIDLITTKEEKMIRLMKNSIEEGNEVKRRKNQDCKEECDRKLSKVSKDFDD